MTTGPMTTSPTTTSSMAAAYLNELGIVCSLGHGAEAVAHSLFASDAPRGVTVTDAYTPGRPLAVGQVVEALPDLSDCPLSMRTRNNALLRMAHPATSARPALSSA